MSLQRLNEAYFVRESLYNLVELSLLAKFYEEYCTPNSFSGNLDKVSVSQTLLKMKATEGKGQLRVAIFETGPVGFYWVFEGQVLANWVHPAHREQGVETFLKGNA